MDRTTVTAKLKPLQRRGLIIVTPDPNDQRSRHLALTELGRETLARAFPVWQRTHADVERILDDPDAATLRRGLAKISAGAARSASANGA
jgi:DNA-binding MarR family transcriptional regulator